MAKLSILIFSKDDVRLTIELLKEIRTIADDIVLVTGNHWELNSFESAKKELKLKNLRIFYALSLGYSDPARLYGIKQCRYDWILNLDVDELPSERLKADIRKIIGNKGASAFAIKRTENSALLSRGIFTWQVRLFRKERTTFKGIIHELPEVKGRTVKLLQDDYFLTHKERYTSKEKSRRYLAIEAYTRRMSYLDVLALSKKRGLPSLPLSLYIKIKGAKLGSELSRFDYNSFLLAYSTAVYFSKFSKSPYIGWGGGFRYTYDYNKNKINYFFDFTTTERKLQFDISQEVTRANGVINYLGLDSDETIKFLNSRFAKTTKAGVDIFVQILKMRHSYGKKYLSKL